MEKDFSTISMSAVSLLLQKAFTDIAFAKEAALFMFGEQAVTKYAENLKANPNMLSRLLHFEERYKTVDEALEKTGISNIIEISSGFSFRGLTLCGNEKIHYADTDLPNIIEMKTEVITNMANQLPANYILNPLNVLDADAFLKVAESLPAGPVCIVNEGLLVYFTRDEKRMLCSIILAILKQRGGVWVTGDIYIKNGVKIERDEQTQKFLDAHNVEKNKFTDYEDAETFFTSCGLSVKERMITSATPLSALKFADIQPPAEQEDKTTKHIRETWVLKAH